MIGEVRKRVAREITLALSERAREEEALPTDLWKRTVRKFSNLSIKVFLLKHIYIQTNKNSNKSYI